MDDEYFDSLLATDDVTVSGGNAWKVWQRNVELLQDLDESMGRSSVEDLFNVSSGKPVKGQLGKILQRHRLKLSSDGDHDDSSTT